MRKFLMTMMLSVSILGAKAGDYDYLVLVSQPSGSAATLSSIASNGLTITFANGNIVLTPAEGDVKSLPIDELQMMYFSDTAEGGEIVTPTLIQEALAEMESEAVDVYGTDGSYCGRYDNLKAAQDALQRGVYLVKNKEKTVKIAVK